MSVFADNLDLRTAVVENSSERIVDVWPRLLRKAENNINKRLRIRQMLKSATVTFDANGLAPFPDDFLEIIDLRNTQFDSSNLSSIPYEIGSGTNRQYLNYNDSYSVRSDGFFMTGFEGDRDIIYYAKIPSITGGDSATSEILTAYPELYEYAATVEAARYLKDLELMQAYLTFYTDEILLTRQQSNAERYGASKVRVNGATP